jgi:hypothetical protein
MQHPSQDDEPAHQWRPPAHEVEHLVAAALGSSATDTVRAPQHHLHTRTDGAAAALAGLRVADVPPSWLAVTAGVTVLMAGMLQRKRSKPATTPAAAAPHKPADAATTAAEQSPQQQQAELHKELPAAVQKALGSSNHATPAPSPSASEVRRASGRRYV